MKKARHTRKDTTRCHLHDESKIVKLIEAEWLPRAGGRVFKKVQSFSYTKLINLKDLLYSIMPIVTIVYLKICYNNRSHMTYSFHKITNIIYNK